jgi:hypothetical protein
MHPPMARIDFLDSQSILMDVCLLSTSSSSTLWRLFVGKKQIVEIARKFPQNITEKRVTGCA